MKNNPLPRLDHDSPVRQSLLRHCRLSPGQIWTDPHAGHKVGCLDAANPEDINNLLAANKAQLAVHDPPYNLVAFQQRQLDEFINWCEKWIANTMSHLDTDASVYFWLGADQNNGFQPLPDFMIMMRKFKELLSRSFITMRNQRGYGTAKNWMAVRQELLYYIKGSPTFNVQYTDIPKILKGYYKEVDGQLTENSQRSKSPFIRAGNVWVDIQQVFYRMHENVTGCYAQKPLKAIDRIIQASSKAGDLVLDFFAHSGATLISAETLSRKCYTIDTDPIFCEITIRRLERFRQTGETGWQNSDPFEELSQQ
ncbi:MAG TPA: site-specific DNA-methyltransferase [Sedimentisphaerales bacterium]|nr:site-specific DNA-methyltransferase [Sedimentisphaerales bacterium]